MVEVAQRVLSALDGRTILVTGGAGFVGARVVAAARARGAHVVVVGRSTPPTRDGVEVIQADVCDRDAIVGAVARSRADAVVHCAGVGDWRQDAALTPLMLRVHAVGTANVLEAARRAGVARAVIVGSSGEYGAAPSPCREAGPALPLDPYSVSKLAATELALTYHRSFGLACVVVRPFVVFGPGEPTQRLLPSLFVRALAGGGEVSFTPGEQVRDFVYVDDVAEGILRALTCDAAAGAVINLGTGVGTSVRDAVSAAVGLAGGTVRPLFGALPYRTGEPMELVASTARAHELLGWSPPTTLAEGLHCYWCSLRDGAL